MAYLIPISSLPLAEQQARRAAAVASGRQALVDAAVVKSIANVIDRDADYPVDFIPAATRAGLTGWVTQTPLVAGTVYNVLADNTGAAVIPQVPNNQVWVFYGVHIGTAIPANPASQLYFSIGQSAIRKAAFDLEKMSDKLEESGYFTSPVVYSPQDIVTITFRARAVAGTGVRVILDTLIFEPVQNTQI